jgi:hypothetical protein
MKVWAAFTLFSACLASAAAIQEDLDIPGDSPLQLCANYDHSKDTIHITSVDLDPNPPKAGQALVIKAKGTVDEEIGEGAYVLLTVKYGLIRLISSKADLCDQIKNVDLECPVKPGEIEVTKSVDLPKEIPPGKYTVLADVYSDKGEKITCLTATVNFSRGSSIFGNEL